MPVHLYLCGHIFSDRAGMVVCAGAPLSSSAPCKDARRPTYQMAVPMHDVCTGLGCNMTFCRCAVTAQRAAGCGPDRCPAIPATAAWFLRGRTGVCIMFLPMPGLSTVTSSLDTTTALLPQRAGRAARWASVQMHGLGLLRCPNPRCLQPSGSP